MFFLAAYCYVYYCLVSCCEGINFVVALVICVKRNITGIVKTFIMGIVHVVNVFYISIVYEMACYIDLFMVSILEMY